MSWTSCEYIFDESYKIEEIKAEIEECLEMEVDSIPPSHLKWVEHEDIMDSEENAREILDNHYVPREQNIIIRYKKWTYSKKAETLQKRLLDVQTSLDNLIAEKAPENFKAAYISCPECGSKINRNYFKEYKHNCLVCGGEMWADTTQKRHSGYVMKIIQLQDEIAKCKKKYEVMSLAKGYLYLG